MAILTVVAVACVPVLVVPLLVFLCADGKESSKPKLKSIKKKGSKSAGDYEQSKSNGSSSRKNKSADLEKVTVVANGSALEAYEEVEAGTDIAPSASANTYEEPELLASSPKHVNDALTNGTQMSVENETSPSGSQRSSRASNGQSRLSSQDRALPDLPSHAARHSLTSERSPSTKRALPDLPPTQSSDPTVDDGSNVYDQLERDIAPHQIRSKSTSVKTNAKLVIENDMDSADEIEPDEVTRNSIVFGAGLPSAGTNEVYSQVNEHTPSSSAEPSSPAATSAEGSKPKAKVQYSKVKKDSSSSEGGVKSPSSQVPGDPIYSAAPPVPDKLFELEEAPGAAAEGAAAAGNRGVAIVIDDNAQDSGSGYYAVADDGPALDIHQSAPESYDILTARESIASVRARQKKLEQEDDYYESLDDKPAVGAAGGSNLAASRSYTDSTTELYAEIDNHSGAAGTSGATARIQTGREELYDEIDLVSSAEARGASTSKLPVPSHISDPGYERVDFGIIKGEQTDSAGYASGYATGTSAAADDDEDYAECDMLPAGASANSLITPSNPITRTGSDVSDYATVTFNGAEGATAQPAAPQAAAESKESSDGNQSKPFQKYRRREHLYQEIDEVREETKNNPPDKRS